MTGPMASKNRHFIQFRQEKYRAPRSYGETSHCASILFLPIMSGELEVFLDSVKQVKARTNVLRHGRVRLIFRTADDTPTVHSQTDRLCRKENAGHAEFARMPAFCRC